MTKNPWRSILSISPLIDGEQFFPALLQAIHNSKHSIHVSLYWFESGDIGNQFIDAFAQACQRGVFVSCMLDEIGSKDLNETDRQRLIEAGVLLGWYNPVKLEKLHLIFHRDHSKIFVFDQKVLMVGGTGIADIFVPLSRQTSVQTSRIHWRENMFELTGDIVEDALQSIAVKWQKNTGHQTRRAIIKALKNSLKFDRLSIAKKESTTGPKGRWLQATSRDQRQILTAVIQRIKQSKNHVYLTTAYFAPDPRLRIALNRAARQGVKVVMLLPGARAAGDHPLLQRAGQYYYLSLLKEGVQIYEYGDAFLHGKLVVCDEVTCIGSSNFDIYTLDWSLEANIEVVDHQLAQKMINVLNNDLENSTQVTLEAWEHRHWWNKFLNFMAFKLISVLYRISRQLLVYVRVK